jgi:hypothetical protein
MATDSAWTATVDSLRQDLSRMRAMPASKIAMIAARKQQFPRTPIG